MRVNALGEVSAKQQEEAYSAWRIGEPVEIWDEHREEWRDLHHGHFISSRNMLRRKPQPQPQPKLRPWKPEEIPVGAVVREAVGFQPHARWLITSVDYQGVAYTAYGQNKVTTLALEGREYSIDHGKTWLPCGVVE